MTANFGKWNISNFVKRKISKAKFEINFDRQLTVDYVLMQLAFEKTRVKLNCKNMHTILN